MQKPDLSKIDEGILARHEAMYDAYYADLPLIEKGRHCDVRFDELESDPVGTIKDIYDQLSLEGYAGIKPKLDQYVASLSGYKKNKFTSLDDATRELVAKHWKRSFETGNYPT